MRAFLASLAVLFALLTLRILHYKHFTIDEFQYAHASWLVAHGQIPYRDFFNDRFPLLYQTLGAVPLLGNAKPQDILLLRWAMLPALAAIVACCAVLNRRRGAVTALLGVLFLLATPAFTTRATEIRPDPLAFALFLCAIAVLSSNRIRTSVAAPIAGCLVASSLWTSLKVAVYGVVFIALLWRRKTLPRFVAGFAVVVALIAAYLLMSRSMTDWFTWSVKWAWVHEAEYPAFPRYTAAIPFLRDSWWLLVLGLIGWIRDLRSSDILLALALPATLLSFAIQRAPFEYSLLPFIGVLAIFASRAMGMLFERNRAVVAILAGAISIYSAIQTWRAASQSNEVQLTTLRRLDVVTKPTDAVYDNTGAYFARPNAWYFFYTDEVLRRRLGSAMTASVEEALLRSQAPAVLMDRRFNGLPPELQTFIRDHYQPYSGDICLWGMRFGNASGQFWAIQSGEYFVDPPMPLTIDGQRIASAVFPLSAGSHSVSGGSPFLILWLPRDRRPYVPSTLPARSVFSFL